MNKLPQIKLPVWMNKGEPLTLAHASKTWWERVYGWLSFPLAQIDPDTCDERLLDLLAYQRDVERFPGESLSLFRLRVKFAFVNAQDAGSMAGFARIFERLDIGKIQQLERQLQYDWDVILVRINDAQLSRDNTLMMRLVRQYGRTCRRYFFDVVNQVTVTTHGGEFDVNAEYHHAVYTPPLELVRIHINGWMVAPDGFAPVTCFKGAFYTLEIQGVAGGLSWKIDGPATAGSDGTVTITGPGAVTVTATDGMGRSVSHAINPSYYFIPSVRQMALTAFAAWAEAQGGTLPGYSKMTTNRTVSASSPARKLGTLWTEWGDMSVYGWRAKRSPTSNEQEYWSTSAANATAKTLVGLRRGTLITLSIDNPGKFSAVAYISLLEE